MTAIGDELEQQIFNVLEHKTLDERAALELIMGYVIADREQQTKQALEVARKDVELALRWNRPLKEVLDIMNRRIEASAKQDHSHHA